MNAANRTPASWIALIAALLAMPVAGAQSSADDGALSAFAGTWILKPSTNTTPPPSAYTAPPGPPPMLRSFMPRFRPEVAAKIMANARPPAPGAGQDRGYCRPMAFAGAMGYAVVPVSALTLSFEILHSPGRLTVLDEMGMIRRIYLRDQPPVDALEQSNGGTSIAKFEGRTLVVHTTGLNPDAPVMLGTPGAELGRGASVLERITPTTDGFEIITTVTAPELYRAPVTTTNRYVRMAHPMIEMSACDAQDRSWNPATGTERFDATPPADLPPPPN